MSMSSVTASGNSAPTGAIDGIASESGSHPPASGFDALLAAHGDGQGGAAAHVSERDSNNDPSGTHDPATQCDTAGDSQPPAKVDRTTDAETMAAQLAAQAAGTTPSPTDPAPAGNQLDSAAVLDAAASPAGDPSGATAAAGAGAAPDPATAVVDPPAPPATPNLTAILAAATPTDPSAANHVSVEIPPLLGDRTSAHAPGRDPSAPTIAPSLSPVPPDPARLDHARPAPTDTGSVGFAPVNGPTSAPAEAHAAEVAAATAPAPPPPAEQLVSILSPLRTSLNGTYTLRLELKPEELGRVEMRVEMRDGVLHASIHADHESSAQLVRASLNELRDQLAAEGVRTGSLTVSDGALGSSGHDGDARQTAAGASLRSASAEPNLAAADEQLLTNPGGNALPIDSEASSLLDVRV